MIAGIIAVVLFIIVCLRMTKKRLFMKLHMPAGVALAALAAAHVLLTAGLLRSRPVTVPVSGIAAVIFIVLAGCTGMRRKRKAHKITALCAFIFIAAHVVFNMAGLTAYQNEVKNIETAGVDLSRVPDGMYVGECDVTFIYAKVQVTVKSGEIADIVILEHRNERGGPAEAITDDIVSQQRIGVDAVAHATNSSAVIKKAVENAVRGSAHTPAPLPAGVQ